MKMLLLSLSLMASSVALGSSCGDKYIADDKIVSQYRCYKYENSVKYVFCLTKGIRSNNNVEYVYINGENLKPSIFIEDGPLKFAAAYKKNDFSSVYEDDNKLEAKNFSPDSYNDGNFYKFEFVLDKTTNEAVFQTFAKSPNPEAEWQSYPKIGLKCHINDLSTDN